jgi:hypothetical protein
MPPSIGWLVVCVTYLAFQVCTSFAFMKGLLNAMTDEDPGKHPSHGIEDVVLRRFRIRYLDHCVGCWSCCHGCVQYSFLVMDKRLLR